MRKRWKVDGRKEKNEMKPQIAPIKAVGFAQIK
jgi:hypothetical protein